MRTWSRRTLFLGRPRLLAAGTVLALAVATAATTPGPAAAAESAGATGTTAAAAFAVPGTPVTLTPNPADAGPEFQGWGTSLAWFAEATGEYPDALRNELVDKVFGEDGLRLTIARYNIGGGNATDIPTDYFRLGGAIPGWWNPDAPLTDADGAVTATFADRARYLAAWTGENGSDYDLDADPAQDWWVSAIKDKVDTWEAFSNSPPYFMTTSGYVTGGLSSTTDQINPAAYTTFATYLKTVVQHLESTQGIQFSTIEPLNEPNTNYWGTSFNTDGSLKCCRQEGAHAGPSSQDAVIQALAAELAEPDTTTDAVVSSPDETNPSTFVTDWSGWSTAARSAVSQLNTHTYGTGDRVKVRDIAHTSGKPLWMSEVEGNWGGSGFNPTSMENGLGLAGQITSDLRELQPSAWVFWQPVENYYNMQKVEKLNWGSIFVDFDCDADGNSAQRIADGDADPSCRILVNSKYNVSRNFTHYIEPGDHIIPTDNAATTSAVKGDGSGAVLVHANNSTSDEAVTIDLRKFGTIAAGATVTPIVTTQSTDADPTANALVAGTPEAVDLQTGTATLSVPAKSVTTFVVSGVSGVAAAAEPLQGGHTYQIVGVQSGKALTATTSGTAATTITSPGTTVDGTLNQRWTATAVSGSGTTARWVLSTPDGRILTAQSSGTVLSTESVETAETDPNALWIPTTTDGKTYSLVNVALTMAMDVGSQSTAENATVGVYGSNNGSNQAWTLRDTAATGVEPVVAATEPGVAPALPDTVTPTYAWGTGVPVAVTWDTAGQSWDSAGTVTIIGTATDVYGGAVPEVTALVEIGEFTVTDPVSVTVPVGVSSAAVTLPDTVPARIGASERTHPVAVDWDRTPLTIDSLAAPGIVTLAGTAGGLPATASVIVTAGTSANFASSGAVTASATFTESGYNVDNTLNGVTTDKAWSNWVSSPKRTGDTLTYTFGRRDLAGATIIFYKDGSNESWAGSVQIQYRDPSTGNWQDAPGTVSMPTAEVPTASVALGGVAATGVRFALTPTSTGYMTVAEVTLDAISAAPGSTADAAALRIDGSSVPDFAATTVDYTVETAGNDLPTVTAIAIDQAASVTVQQADPGTRTATVQITAADGTATRTYTVAFPRPDTTAPVVTVAVDPVAPTGSNGWYTTAPQIVATASDASAVTTIEYRVGSGGWRAYPGPLTPAQGTHSYQFRATDAKGNTSAATDALTVRVDSTAPVATATFDDKRGTTAGPIRVTVSATDSGSGVASIRYQVDNGSWQTRAAAPAVVSVSGAGSHTLRYAATDIAGNTATTKTATVRIAKADRTAPKLTVKRTPASPTGSAGWYRGTVRISAAATDPVVAGAITSGVAKIQYRIGAGAWRTYTAAISAPSGITSYRLRAVDRAGNISATRTVVLRRDATAPTTSASVSRNGGRSVTIRLVAKDTASGVAAIRYRIDGKAATTYRSPIVLRTPGRHRVTYSATDKAGNTSAGKTIVVT